MLDWQTFYNQNKNLPLNEIVAKFYKLQALIEENINHQITLSQTTSATAGSAGGVDEGPSGPFPFLDNFDVTAPISLYINPTETSSSILPGGSCPFTRVVSGSNVKTPSSAFIIDLFGYDPRRINLGMNPGPVNGYDGYFIGDIGDSNTLGSTWSIVYGPDIGDLTLFGQTQFKVDFIDTKYTGSLYTFKITDSSDQVSTQSKYNIIAGPEVLTFDFSSFTGSADLTDVKYVEFEVNPVNGLTDSVINFIGTNNDVSVLD